MNLFYYVLSKQAHKILLQDPEINGFDDIGQIYKVVRKANYNVPTAQVLVFQRKDISGQFSVNNCYLMKMPVYTESKISDPCAIVFDDRDPELILAESVVDSLNEEEVPY